MPLWIKLLHSLFLCIMVPVYWRHYGPANFLWFSDIALFLSAAALWLESPWLASMAAVSVLLLELAWNLDFFVRLLTGRRLLGLADYMFDRRKPLHLRALSLFHVALPVLLVWMVLKLGYEPRAALAQSILAWVILPCTYWLTRPQDNINWVFGFGRPPRRWLSPRLHLIAFMALFPLCIYLPTHLLLVLIDRQW